jgi:CheY-like chemotaxis protein
LKAARDMQEIWYVENDDDDVFLLERAFRKIGLENVIRHFPRGEAFKRALQSPVPGQGGPMLFLFDLKLDGESGLDLLRWVKANPGTAITPAFIFSSGNMPQELLRSRELEAKAYIFKPLAAEEWKDVADYLATSAGLRQGPSTLPSIAKVES